MGYGVLLCSLLVISLFFFFFFFCLTNVYKLLFLSLQLRVSQITLQHGQHIISTTSNRLLPLQVKQRKVCTAAT